MTLKEEVTDKLNNILSTPRESNVAFLALCISRREDGSFNSTIFHVEEELTNDLRGQIAQLLRNLADDIQKGE